MSALEHGPLLQRFEVDASEERVFARVRTLAALAAVCGSGLVLLGDLPIPVFMAGVLALLISMVWLVQARRARARAARPETHFLAVHTEGLLLSEGEKTTWVAWASVREVEVDEERLDIVVVREPPPPLRIEPRYPGVEIHSLMDTLRNAWLSTHDPDTARDASTPRRGVSTPEADVE